MPTDSRSPASESGVLVRLWRLYCRVAVRAFYRQVEIVGEENLPATGAALVCSNHYNSLADVVLVQYASSRILHPLARSGLFEKPLLRHLLRFLQAVPVYRAHDPGTDTAQNRGSFDRCFELLEEGHALLIFPEGISHSEPELQEVKTGAARIALGHHFGDGDLAAIVPVGMTFVERGRFRSRVLLQIGPPVSWSDIADDAIAAASESDGDGFDKVRAAASPPPGPVRELTARIEAAIRDLTLNADTWEDIGLVRELERFFHFRRGRHPRETPLASRFRTFKRLLRTYRELRETSPEEIAKLKHELTWFARLRRLYGITDYHLRREYSPKRIMWFIARHLTAVALLLPVALVGIVLSYPPWRLSGALAPRFAGGPDQIDTTKIALGTVLFGLFWGAQIALAYTFWGSWAALGLAILLPLTGLIALALKDRRREIERDVRAFFLFRKKRDLKGYLLERRLEIEDLVAELANRARTMAPRRPRAADLEKAGGAEPSG